MGQGQHIDLALLDTQVAWLINAGQYYLTSGRLPPRLANGHPNIVPYQVFPSEDGHFILAVGNDAQFLRFCQFAGAAELAEDDRFSTNAGRVRNRDELIPRLKTLTMLKTAEQWVEGLERLGVPCGPVNSIDQVFSDPQVAHRRMRISLPYAGCKGEAVDLIGSPIRMSETPVSYRRAPPRLGQDAEEILGEVLGYDEARIQELKESRTAAIATGR